MRIAEGGIIVWDTDECRKIKPKVRKAFRLYPDARWATISW
jgi:hypothetical protein